MTVAFYSTYWISTQVVYLSGVWLLHGRCHMKLLPSRPVLCPLCSHAPCHVMQSHIHEVHACLAVTCPLHFWQNDGDLLCATVVTRTCNGYWDKSQHRNLPWRRKTCCSCRDSNLWPFNHKFSALTTELSLFPSEQPCLRVFVCVSACVIACMCACVSF